MQKIYAFWNNKGGTGKTSLAFQAVCRYCELHPTERVLAIDVCPQANLSELLLGGLTGNGSGHLQNLYGTSPRTSVGGYFQLRLPSPYSVPTFNGHTYLIQPHTYNNAIPQNLMLFAGDAIVELQSNAISTLANTQIPGTNTWLSVIDWLKDFIDNVGADFDVAFIDCNPSFSVYTQIALAAAQRLVLPVMADDSSRRAIQNAFSLVHGLNLPSPIYSQYAFNTRLSQAGRQAPSVHLVVKNRLTQYMGPASAYHTVLSTIDNQLSTLLSSNPAMFTFNALADGLAEVRDFQTTGVVAYAKGLPFSRLQQGRIHVLGRRITVKGDYLQNCRNAITAMTNKL